MAEQKNTAVWLDRAEELSSGRLAQMVIRLSIPAILAELTSIVMQYIDAAMVGSMGAEASAAIGLVSSSSWLLGGLCISAATGFSVQIAHLSGAGRKEEAKDVFCQSLLLGLLFGIMLSIIGICLSPILPVWLGGKPEITSAASRYFLIFSCALPATQFRQLAGSILQCSGDMKTPSILNIIMCILDVIFNFILIFPTRQVILCGFPITIIGAGMGVAGAALGTALSEVVVTLAMLWAACVRSKELRLIGGRRRERKTIYYKRAAGISLPIALEHMILCGAQVALTHITAPLGTVAIAANTLAVTAESLCYMPGFGVGTAATTLVGQSLGAGNQRLAKRYGWISVWLGMGIMSVMGILMFLAAPYMFAMLTPDRTVRLLGTRVLRIEAFAEPLYAASIVAAGALRGAGDTLIPSILNLISMWGIRITTAAILAPRLGLYGVWVAMCGELCIRGTLFLIRLGRGRWLQRDLVSHE